MISGSTGRVKSRRFRTVRVVVSSLSTVARSMGRSPLHRSQARIAWQWILRKGYGSIVHATGRGHNREEDLATRERDTGTGESAELRRHRLFLQIILGLPGQSSHRRHAEPVVCRYTMLETAVQIIERSDHQDCMDYSRVRRGDSDFWCPGSIE